MNSRFEIVVLGGEPTLVGILNAWTHTHVEYQTVAIDGIDNALRRYRVSRPDLVILDLGSPRGFADIEAFRRIDREIPILAVSPRHSPAAVVRAVKLGATDVVSAPLDPREIATALERALPLRRPRRESPARQTVDPQSKHAMLFGTGAAMSELRNLIERVGDLNVPVLIRGESGTGKELVARALAASTFRRGKPFIKINCAAMPGELLEAELFGFERGAFTGAVNRKLGKFEVADGGTIFLDEVGEMSLSMQSKLLQVLQDGHFSRLGGHGDMCSTVRVIAATNRDLDRAVRDGSFRSDILFRLNVIPMWMPPLRERQDDIPALVEFFMKRWTAFYKKPDSSISPDLMANFLRYRWPGNIRELENLIKGVIVLGTEAAARGAVSTNSLAPAMMRPSTSSNAVAAVAAGLTDPAADLADDVNAGTLKRVSRRAARQAEGALIARMLQQTRGNRKRAAMNLGISYKALLYKAKEHGFDPAHRRHAAAPFAIV